MPTRYARRPVRLLALVAAVGALAVPGALRAQTPAPPAVALPFAVGGALSPAARAYLLTDGRWQIKQDEADPYQDFYHAAYTLSNGRYARVEFEGLDFMSLPPAFGLTSATDFTYGANSRTATHYARRNNVWEPTDRTTSTYDGSNRETQTLNQDYRNGAWVDTSRTVSTYGADFFPTESLYQNFVAGTWTNESRTLTSRSGTNLVTVDQDWNGTAWVNTDRTTLPYESYRSFYEAFEPVSIDLFALYADPAVIQAQYFDVLEETWNGSAWVNDTRSTATRDGQGRALTRFLERWNGTAWAADNRDTLTYTNGRLSRTTSWDYSTVPTGELDTITNYTYDGNGNATEVEFISYDEGEPASFFRFLFQWAGVTAAAPEAPLADRLGLATHPNPARGAVTARFALPEAGPVTLRVLDLTGREVARVAAGVRPAGEGTAALALGGLPAGLYVLRLETAAGATSRPLTLVH